MKANDGRCPQQDLQRELERLRGAVAALREDTELLELLFANVPFYLAYLDLDFNFIRVNEPYARSEGRDPEYFVGRNHFDLYPNEENRNIFRSVAETGEPCYAIEKPFVFESHPERGVTYWDWSLHPVRVEGGPVCGLLLSLVDVTERKKAQLAEQESEAKFRLMTETIREVFWMSTPGVQKMIYVSPAYEEIWGRSLESLYASPRSYIEAIHPDDRARVQEAVKNHAEGQYRVEYRVIRPDGSLRWISDRGFPVRDEENRLKAMTGVAMDITEQKLVEEELLDQQRRMRRLANEVAVAEGRERRRLAAELHDTVAQELALAKMRLEVLASGAHGAPPPECRLEMMEISDLVGRAMTQTRALMSELNPLSLLEGDLNGALSGLVRRLESSYDLRVELQGAGSAASLDEDCRFFLFRAIREILLNVVKHARARRATVTLRDDGEWLQVTVEDDGRGFTPEALSGQKSDPSGGYGLYNIRERVKALSGEMEIDSGPGRGSRVTLSVPLGRGEAAS